jgi:hypothetical protein
MYDKLNENRGILNDYDLAYLNGQNLPTGTEHTGTMPFMALELLTKKALAGKVTRQYRHDCESFAWVLLWICCRYDEGIEIKNAPLNELITDNHIQCFKEKQAILSNLDEISPTPSYQAFWSASKVLIGQFAKEHSIEILDGTQIRRNPHQTNHPMILRGWCRGVEKFCRRTR